MLRQRAPGGRTTIRWQRARACRRRACRWRELVCRARGSRKGGGMTHANAKTHIHPTPHPPASPVGPTAYPWPVGYGARAIALRVASLASGVFDKTCYVMYVTPAALLFLPLPPPRASPLPSALRTRRLRNLSSRRRRLYLCPKPCHTRCRARRPAHCPCRYPCLRLRRCSSREPAQDLLLLPTSTSRRLYRAAPTRSRSPSWPPSPRTASSYPPSRATSSATGEPTPCSSHTAAAGQSPDTQ